MPGESCTSPQGEGNASIPADVSGPGHPVLSSWTGPPAPCISLDQLRSSNVTTSDGVVHLVHVQLALYTTPDRFSDPAG
jgi:hypothetical protein